MADLDVAQYLGARADQNAVRDLGVPVLFFLARAAQSDRVQHRHVIAHNRRFANDDAVCVVDHDPLANFRGRVDVDSEHLGHAHLEKAGHVAAPLAPQPMRNAVSLKRLKSLEEQQRQDIAVAGRITVIDRHDIGARGGPDIGIAAIGPVADFPQDLLGHLVRGQLH